MFTNLQWVIHATRADAASRVGIPPDAVEVVRAQSVTWSDGSLGCPTPGMQYTQALVSGYRVILKARGQEFDYHAAANGHFSLCPPERAIPPVADDRI